MWISGPKAVEKVPVLGTDPDIGQNETIIMQISIPTSGVSIAGEHRARHREDDGFYD